MTISSEIIAHQLCAMFYFADFFENLAFEAKLDADKSVMIKNCIHARKLTTKRRAQTMLIRPGRPERRRQELGIP